TPRLPEAAGAVRPAPPAVTPERADEPPVRVYLSRTGGVETVPLEQYVTGVLAAEMPAGFELEALKAQAIAARTFIVRRLATGDTSGTPNRRADVNDTVSHQAYISQAQLSKWPDNGKAEGLAKLQQAVKQTKGLVLVYQGKPITASFFSSSGGYTENSEEYWSVKIPYLRSVPSPWEATINPSNRQTFDIPVDRVLRKLGQQASETSESAFASGSSSRKQAGTAQTRKVNKPIQVLSLTTGRKVKEIRIGGQIYTGREVREKLGLRSTQFTMALDGEDVKITTYGYGHGIGMSQWGANGMAKEGFTATQILKHYYTGVSFQQASHFIK
ncbi:stage II sporulation protein D, partial [Paenibacillus puldeungensis]